MVQMLEVALLDGIDKEFDLIHPSSLKALVDSLAMLPVKSGSAKLQDHNKCLLQGTDLSSMSYHLTSLSKLYQFADSVPCVLVVRRGQLHEAREASGSASPDTSF